MDPTTQQLAASGFDIWQAIQNVGLPAVLVVSLLWWIRSELKTLREREDRERDKQHITAVERETKLSNRLTQIEDFQRNELASMNKEMVSAMRDLTNVIERREGVRLMT